MQTIKDLCESWGDIVLRVDAGSSTGFATKILPSNKDGFYYGAHLEFKLETATVGEIVEWMNKRVSEMGLCVEANPTTVNKGADIVL